MALAAACFVMGIGFGYVASPGVIVAQSSVGWSDRGVATGTNMFARSMGSAVGVAVFGAIANAAVARPRRRPAPTSSTCRRVLEPRSTRSSSVPVSPRSS